MPCLGSTMSDAIVRLAAWLAFLTLAWGSIPSRAFGAQSRPTRGGEISNQTAASVVEAPLPGMPAVLDSRDIYAADQPNKLSPTISSFPRAFTFRIARALRLM
jgi:hypothetical protein